MVEIPDTTTIAGLEKLYKQKYSLAARYDKLTAMIAARAEEIRNARQSNGPDNGEPEIREYRLRIPRGIVRSSSDLDELLQILENARLAIAQGKTVIIE